jgi:Leucine-rich repeat (LRR) protein
VVAMDAKSTFHFNFLFLQLEALNFGNNRLEELPEVLFYLESLQKLHLFKNLLKDLNPRVLGKYILRSFGTGRSLPLLREG